MPTVEIICLANSRKLRGRCVAGLRTDGQDWVRPVSHRPDGTLYWQHYRLSDGTEACVLDLLKLDLDRHVPQVHQPENWIIGRTPWALVARPAPARHLTLLRAYLAKRPNLLGNRRDSVSYAALRARPARSSLALVAPGRLRWKIQTSFRGRRQTRALFTLVGVEYDLVVTDPLWEKRLRSLDYGVHPLATAGVASNTEVLLTVSLGEPFEGYCYKLVAAVIELSRRGAAR